MYKLLTKLFIKNRDQVNDNNVRGAYGALCGIVGIVSNLFIAGIKILAGWLSGSIAIVADGINSLTDGGSSVITLLAFKFANAPADPEHPFGHERLEYIAGLFVSIIILIIGGFLAESSITKIITPTPIETENFYLLLGILIASILIKIWQCLFYRKAGKTINSETLIASGFDSLADVLSTVSVAVALMVAHFWDLLIDGYMGLAVSLFIIYSGIKLVKDTISPLLGEAPSEELVQSIKDKLLSYKDVLGYHDLVIHSYGPANNFVTVHVEVDANVDIILSHEMIDTIEQDFLKDLNINVVIHLDPIVIDEETTFLKGEVQKIIKEIDERIDFHDFRVVKGIKQTKVLFDVVVPNKFIYKDKDLRDLITKKIQELNSHYLVYIVIDHNYLG